MKTALIGSAGCGKTTLFGALVGTQAVGLGRAKVPEQRLDPLTELYKAKKTTYAEIEYQDTQGGLSERVFSDAKMSDCLLAVVDAFSGAKNPMDQWREIESEILFTDLAVIEKRLERIAIDKKKNRDLVNAKEEELLTQGKALLESEKALRTESAIAQAPELKTFRFISAKPIVFAWNINEGETLQLPANSAQVTHISVCAKIEHEIAEITDPEERKAFLQDMGIEKTALSQVIAATYDMMGLITFLTAGEKEVRSWPIRKGSTAPQAAGVIHSDLERGFIRAIVLGWQDFLKVADFKKAKELGLLRKEGKEYIVQDGDIIEFLFNV